jgi:hypothetical protein
LTIEAAVMERDGGRCFKCGAPLTTSWPGYSCHHRRLRGAGGTDTPENRIMLCGSGTTGCHGWVHAHPALARGEGWLCSRYGLAPEETPVLHWQLGRVFLTEDARVLSPEQYAKEGTDGQG